ncbi:MULTISPECIES: dihydrodipicolinate synthase family protein [Microbacterium]|uniref:dihydrodipicolinate synthase family protein n=1 Tax=Microbacterium TaxID=33882 RepID=UPI00049370F0|nr:MULTISPECIES: dihydrodipicolinate synthase family protein [Microbacterium]NIG65584.1 dihydrodipicolinate synthase family protein [Microbacterium sp. Be9]MCV0334690.1 dihydrodipicolinate synthase family protein [Microbacterium sp.]MCV0374131.1 dihydrodipicolinate synthase family protein [Microbacterium sp.]MCV0391341.1 dihydrodipicolinate synthase family protein [Microbacterium sp.]MCV0418737.1 dihydrodipicolinate synthase family protein [Microbacterium sp.]
MTRYDILTAVPTAFHRDGTLDIEGSRAIFRFVADSGNEGAFVLGTTGEFPAVDADEFAAIVEAALAELQERMRVVVHVGRPSTFEAVRLTRIARRLGATEFAALTPYYLQATDDAIFEYYRAVSEAVGDGRLYVYIYPARSGNPVSPELLARLARLPNVVGAKISELSLDDIAAYRAVVPADFDLYTGADRDLIAAVEVGAQGVVSGVSSVTPKPFRALADAARSGDAAAIVAAQAAVDDVVALIGGDMARMKEAYRVLDVVDTHCRMAIAEPSAAERTAVAEVVAAHR